MSLIKALLGWQRCRWCARFEARQEITLPNGEKAWLCKECQRSTGLRRRWWQ
jgi:hypothetical protein